MKKLIALLTLFCFQVCAQNTAALMNWKTALGTLQVSTTTYRMLFIGDSLTFGAYGSNPPLTGFPAYMQSLATSAGYNVQEGMAFLQAGSIGGTQLDSRWTVGSGWTIYSPNTGVGPASSFGAGTSLNTAGNLVFTPSYTGNSISSNGFYVYYEVGTYATGTFTAQATGGSVYTFSPTGSTPGIARAFVAAGSASTSNILTITPTVNGYIVILGAEAVLTTKGQMLVANAGASGTTTSSWAGQPLGAVFSNLTTQAFINAYAPSLTVIMLGTNDCPSGTGFGSNVSSTITSQNLQTLITWAKSAGSDVVLMSQPPTNNASDFACYSNLLQIEQSLAATNNVQLYDLFNYWGATWWSSIMYDTIHPTTAGYWGIGNFLFHKLFQ